VSVDVSGGRRQPFVERRLRDGIFEYRGQRHASGVLHCGQQLRHSSISLIERLQYQPQNRGITYWTDAVLTVQGRDVSLAFGGRRGWWCR
jgi:hypothetical protein